MNFLNSLLSEVISDLDKFGLSTGVILQASTSIAGISAAVYAILIQFRDTVSSRSFPTDYDRAKHIHMILHAINHVKTSLNLNLVAIFFLIVYLSIPISAITYFSLVIGTMLFLSGMFSLLTAPGWPFRN